MHYQDHNPKSKKTIILIHGLGASSAMWEYQIKPLTKAGYHVIAPDLPGFGQSEPNHKEATIENMAQEIYDLMDKLNIEAAHIIGLSMGGAVAQKFALTYPEKTQNLVLANTAAQFAGKIMGWKYYAMRYLALNIFPRITGAKAIAKFVFPEKGQEEFREKFIEQIMQANDKTYLQATKSCINHDLRDQVKNIAAPTLIIGGKKDLVTPPFRLKKLHELMPGSKLIMLDGGHVTAVDSAEKFNKETLDFLRKNH